MKEEIIHILNNLYTCISQGYEDIAREILSSLSEEQKKVFLLVQEFQKYYTKEEIDEILKSTMPPKIFTDNTDNLKLFDIFAFHNYTEVSYSLFKNDIYRFKNSFKELLSVMSTYKEECIYTFIRYMCEFMPHFCKVNQNCEINGKNNNLTEKLDLQDPIGVKAVLSHLVSKCSDINDIYNVFTDLYKQLEQRGDIFNKIFEKAFNNDFEKLYKRKFEKYIELEFLFVESFSGFFRNKNLNFITNNSFKEKNDSASVLYTLNWGMGDVINRMENIRELSEKVETLVIYTNNMPPLKKLLEFNLAECGNVRVCTSIDELKSFKFDYICTTTMLYIFPHFQCDIFDKKVSVKRSDAEDFKRKYLKKDKFNIGISYDIECRNPIRKTDLKNILPLTEIEGVQLYSLQYKVPDEKFEGTNIINLGNLFEDVYDTAVAVQAMDMIVTIDNIIMNLSASLGQKTFVIMPNKYFMCHPSASHFRGYHDIKMFFNTGDNDDNDWAENIKRVKTEVENYMKSGECNG